MQDAERAVFNFDLNLLCEACRRGIEPQELTRLVVPILAVGFKKALGVLHDWGAHANVSNERGLRPLELWQEYCDMLDFSYTEELDGLGYDEILLQGCIDLIWWGANPYMCKRKPIHEWCYRRYNEQFKGAVEESLFATLKCLKPKIGKDIARYIGKYIWLNKREWHYWPKAKQPKIAFY